MYVRTKTYGQAEPATEISVKAEVTNVTEPSNNDYIEQVRTDINDQRVKSGLTPLLPADQAEIKPSKTENFTLGGIALLIIIYLLLFKS